MIGKQSLEINARDPGCAVLPEGDIYAMFFEDAESPRARSACGPNAEHGKSGLSIPMCGVPVDKKSDVICIACPHWATRRRVPGAMEASGSSAG